MSIPLTDEGMREAEGLGQNLLPVCSSGRSHTIRRDHPGPLSLSVPQPFPQDLVLSQVPPRAIRL